MKYFNSFLIILSVFILMCCQTEQKQQAVFSEDQKEAVKHDVAEQFNLYVAAINNLNANAWADFFSKTDFISAIVSTDYYSTQIAFTESIKSYFDMRQSQHMEPVAVKITALAANLALLSSEENSEMKLKDGSEGKAKHVYTMLWKKLSDGWKIIHCHESWIDISTK